MTNLENKIIEEFDERFVTNVFGYPKAEDLRDFIREALRRQREEIIEEIEKEKRTLDEQAMEILRHVGLPQGEGNVWNKAIDKMIEIIKGDKDI